MALSRVECPHCYVTVLIAAGIKRVECSGCPAILYVKDGQVQWSAGRGQRAAAAATAQKAPVVSALPTPRPAPPSTAPTQTPPPPPLADVGWQRPSVPEATIGTRMRETLRAAFLRIQALGKQIAAQFREMPPRYFKLAGAIGGVVLLLFVLLAFLLSSDKHATTVAARVDEKSDSVAGTKAGKRPATVSTKAPTRRDEDTSGQGTDDGDQHEDPLIEDNVGDDVGDWSEGDAETATEVEPTPTLHKQRTRQARKSRGRSTRKSRKRQLPEPRHLAKGPTPIQPQSRKPTRAEKKQLARARKTYERANGRLFTGDATKAITHYRRALKEYPPFVASYRGLSLAYMLQGKNRKAVHALQTYVRKARGASDVSLINERIRRLRRKR